MHSAENQFFHLKYSFCRPLDSADRGGHITLPHVATPMGMLYSHTVQFTILEATISLHLSEEGYLPQLLWGRWDDSNSGNNISIVKLHMFRQLDHAHTIKIVQYVANRG